jgi:tetratricopeptide (TPR) repeat protein
VGTKQTPNKPDGKGRPTPSRRKRPAERPLFTEWVVRRGRWVFAGLVVVFAAGFVLFGIGNSGGAGLNDILQNNGGGSNTPTSVPTPDAVKAGLAATKKTPTDASAWAALGAAYSSAGAATTSATVALAQYGKSVAAYEKAKTLKASDADILSALALAYNAQASAADSAAANLSNQASTLQAGQSDAGLFAPGMFGTLINPLTQALDTSLSSQSSALQAKTTPYYTTAAAASKSALGIYLQLTRLKPGDASIWFQMAEAARQTGDKANEILAFQKFLALVPADPLAPQVRTALDDLTKSVTTATAATTSPPTSTK